MCISFPGRVIAVDADGATVVANGRSRRATTVVVPEVEPGDWVLVGSGTILRRLDPDDAVALVDLVAVATGLAPDHRVPERREDS
ncbi:MAG TPA: HypC/HybG/HupF family hydrogenase formation chaperone [Candidatus Limnocylindrales bacterium]|nr:HypC/HybG/HupF family hydrogenase formation chaperone [Candidatus Limnocylindrales bacterium]